MDAQTLIKSSMRAARTLRRGFTPSSESMNEGLEALNMILGSISAQTLIPNRTVESLTPSSAATSYTIGSGGDFNTARPIRIEEMYLQDGNSNDYPVSEMDKQEYALITVKNIDTRPSRFFYNPSYSTGTIYFDSQLATTYTVKLISVKPLTQIATLTTTLSIPDEYLLYLKYTLTMDLANESGKELSPTVMGRAAEAKRIIRANIVANNLPEMRSDVPVGSGAYDIYGDY